MPPHRCSGNCINGLSTVDDLEVLCGSGLPGLISHFSKYSPLLDNSALIAVPWNSTSREVFEALVATQGSFSLSVLPSFCRQTDRSSCSHLGIFPLLLCHQVADEVSCSPLHPLGRSSLPTVSEGHPQVVSERRCS